MVGGGEGLAGGHVGGGEHGEGAVAADLGDGDPGLVAPLPQGGGAHGALEVDVEVPLGQGGQITIGQVRVGYFRGADGHGVILAREHAVRGAETVRSRSTNSTEIAPS